ncbi:MAG TPA: SDR family oxidoreductase [Saprospiraceae bacterium]|nr:SDR family oxidoreductase [Saprospiraceae bacterium]
MNKTAVISGATKGIGLAIAHAFAKEGFDLAVCSRNQEDLDLFARAFAKDYPNSKVWTKVADLSKVNQVKDFARFVQTQFPTVDVLINNAGVFLPGDILTEQEGTLESQIETNLYSAYYLTRELIPAIPKHGHIFNMASIASFMAYPGGGSYTISKFAILGFSKVLREELKKQYIKVTSIMPGATWSNSWQGDNLPPYERLMPPEDIATMVIAAWQLGPSSVVEDLVIRPQLGDL